MIRPITLLPRSAFSIPAESIRAEPTHRGTPNRWLRFDPAPASITKPMQNCAAENPLSINLDTSDDVIESNTLSCN